MDQLEQYKKGLLNKEEIGEFTDKFMRAKYDNDRKGRWQKTLVNEYGLNRSRPEKSSNNRPRQIYAWVAGAAAVMVGLFVWVSNPFATSANSYEQLADAFLIEEFYENQEIIKGDQDVEQLNLQAIFAYNQKDFSTAIGSYEAIIANGVATDEHHFFLGLSYLYAEQPAAAIGHLRKVPVLNANSKFQQDARWFLALAYLKNQDVANGEIVLRSITSSMWYYQKAQQLLEVIDKL